MASPRQTYFCGAFKIEDDSILVADILKVIIIIIVIIIIVIIIIIIIIIIILQVTDRLAIKLPKAGRVSHFRIWTAVDCWLITGSRDQFDLPLQLAANKTRKIKAVHGKFGIKTIYFHYDDC